MKRVVSTWACLVCGLMMGGGLWSCSGPTEDGVSGPKGAKDWPFARRVSPEAEIQEDVMSPDEGRVIWKYMSFTKEGTATLKCNLVRPNIEGQLGIYAGELRKEVKPQLIKMVGLIKGRPNYEVSFTPQPTKIYLARLLFKKGTTSYKLKLDFQEAKPIVKAVDMCGGFCPKGYVCFNQKCRPRPRPARSKGSCGGRCGPGTICLNGLCYPTVQPGATTTASTPEIEKLKQQNPGIKFDLPCDSRCTAVCVAGVCLAPCGGGCEAGEKCDTDRDECVASDLCAKVRCRRGRVCDPETGECVKRKARPKKVCRPACGADETCVRGKCIAKVKKPTPVAETPKAGECVPKCKKGETCVDGVCKTPGFVSARILKVTPISSGAELLLSKGSTSGVKKGAKGKIAGISGGTFKVVEVFPYRSIARTQVKHTALGGAKSVSIPKD